MAKPSMLSMILWVTPIIASTTYSHFRQGPPAKSWTLKYNLLIAVIRTYINGPGAALSPEQMQRGFIQRHQPLPKACKETELTIDKTYRAKGGAILEQHFGKNIGEWDWQGDREQVNDLPASWITPLESPTSTATTQKTLLYFHGGAYFLGTYKLYRPLLGKLALKADARVLAVDYRLAPQHPFPTALEDALSAYLYLLEPPSDAPFDPIPASQIVISGDSAGGGLTMALLLTLRDCGLPLPGGAIPISPWVDLTHSLPSCQANEITDYLPPSFDMTRNHDKDQLHLYAPNQSLQQPLVSPLFDQYQWHGLPPLLIQTGDAEQLRDESICAAFKATNAFGLKSPTLDTTTHRHPLNPTPVILDLYEDQPHVFQLLLPSKSVDRSVQTMADFLRDPSSSSSSSSSSSPLIIRSVSHEGQVQDVTEDMIKIHQGDVWQDWLDRLENGIKDRLVKLAKL